MRTWLSLFFLLVVGCRIQQPAKSESPPPTVTVSRPVSRQVIDWDEYAGHLQAPKVANLTARVSGFVEKVLFQEGSLVHKGDLLMVIDDRLFKADLENRRALVQKDEAQLALAREQLSRSADLLKKKAIAQQEFDTATAQTNQALAQLAADKAAEQTARLNLEWTRVVAPISGRIGRILVTEGNQVSGGAGQATVLTTIVSVDPIYCAVSIPGRAFLQYQQLAEHQPPERSRRPTIPCYVGLENGFVVLAGMSVKNAVLIVEFAKQQEEYHPGIKPADAAIEASRLRLRPILMTSFTFIFGVLPLLNARGAGAEMRQAMGTAVFFGMLGVTLFGIFLTPVFFTVIRELTRGVFPRAKTENPPAKS